MFRPVRVIIRLSFETCFRYTINSEHSGIPKIYMVLDYCCHVYPTVDKSLLWLKSIQIILKSQFYKLKVIKIRSVSYLWVIWHIIHSLVFNLEGQAWQEPEPSHVTGMAVAHCILGKFLRVVCHCFPLSI